MAKKQSQSSTSIESVKHKDKRANIPTEELRDFMTDEDKKPTSVFYPRDTSLDPQLVWKGKDEQDQKPLEVPSVPIYIQEKIHPQAIIEDFRVQAQLEKVENQLNLFGDFNGIKFEQMIDFYQHKEGVKWTNRMILGDSQLVMNSLAEKEGLKGKVQMIYIDPPYGIKFGSNWQVSTRKRDVKDGKAEEATRQPEQIKAFRDTWEFGIHSFLAYLRERLIVARELLTETGSVFIQISDENSHLVRCLMDEVFGSENFIGLIPFRKKTMPFGSKYLEQMADFLIWYGRDKEVTKYRQLYIDKDVRGDQDWVWYLDVNGFCNRMNKDQQQSHNNIDNNSEIFRLKSLEPSGVMQSGKFDSQFQGQTFTYPKNGYATTLEGRRRLSFSNRLQAKGKLLNYRLLFSDYSKSALTIPWNDTVGADDKRYVVQTNTYVIQRCMLMTTDPGDLILDPTCGSGTTAYIAEQWGRRWITIDTSRVALALARTRLMSAQYPYYLLADSLDGIQKESEITKQFLQTQPQTEQNIKKGFVYKRIPHVTSGAIANNPEIDTIYAKWQEQLEPICISLNQLLKESWQEWEIPREPQEKWSQAVKDLLVKWWQLRQLRQKEIDEAIARHADTEVLYDQPYEDKKRVRVTGPFTVESLSPHRVLSTDDRPTSEIEGQQQASDQFEPRIIENLKKAGVQNTVKNERLKFDFLEPHAGVWLHASGEYTEKDGTVKRVAISIGPEYGTVGSEQIKEAAKEAVKGLGCDLLIVCGFGFDPGVSEETKLYGKLTVLTARMNADLLLGEELLKKTGAGNLFMVFGEPDIKMERQDGQLVVTLNGLDIYDPTTGEIRSSSTDDIACWFIDTNYNGESFFVRHAYFTGADQPYDKLKRALRAEIDEDAWSTLYTTTSRPFDLPKGKNGKPGKIAVKVINHYGDEVLKVYEVK
jgi:adenine-specific DNA-methyltransferase